MDAKQILRCPFCNAGQGELDELVTYRRKGGAIRFKPADGFTLECYGCKKSSEFKKSPSGDFIHFGEVREL